MTNEKTLADIFVHADNARARHNARADAALQKLRELHAGPHARHLDVDALGSVEHLASVRIHFGIREARNAARLTEQVLAMAQDEHDGREPSSRPSGR